MMASERLFLIGVGGTGMRGVEAFTHLCAVGMFDDLEIDMLLIDTDTNNGNKSRTEQLVDRYMRIKGGGDATRNSFFTAKLNLYRYAPSYSGETLTYTALSGLATGNEETRRRNRDLSALLFDADVQDFKLDHGYRAQTHLGSHLMYHAIIDAARRVRGDATGRAPRREDESLMKFINRIFEAKEDARVFILGSIFGGTGASAIPILPKALGDALKVRDRNQKLSDQAKFGCSLLTDYFSFNVPDAQQRRDQRIIADSNNFARNSQAALMFYEADATVQRTYERMYHVGWPSRMDWSIGGAAGQTVTGGAEQENPAHAAELLCAAAAHHFLKGPHHGEKAEIVYRSAGMAGSAYAFEAKDFFGQEYAETFRARLGALYALAHITQVVDAGTRNTIGNFERQNIADYNGIPDDDARDLDAYFRSFAFGVDQTAVTPGWLWQVRRSVGGPFILDANAFGDSPAALKQYNFGKLYADDAHQFAAKGGLLGLGSGKPYEEFSKTLYTDPSVRPDTVRQNASRPNERFLAHCFNALMKLYRFA